MTTTGTALTLVELDVDVFRATQFEAAAVGDNLLDISGTRWDQFGSGADLIIVDNDNFPSGRAARAAKVDSSNNSLLQWTVPPNMEDVSLLANLQWYVANNRICARVAANNRFYYAATNGSSFSLGHETSGGNVVVTSMDFPVSNDVPVWIRFDVATIAGPATRLRSKIWTGAAEDEPEDWMLTFDDTAHTIPAAGGVGVFVFAQGALADYGYFRVKSLFGSLEETIRFAEPDKDLPTEFDALSNITALSVTAATISLGEDLGKRAQVSVSFRDHPHAERGEFFDDGTFWGRFRARKIIRRGSNVRVLRGYAGQALASFTRFHYIFDKFDGPTPRDGKFTIVAQDILKFADDDRAMAPRLSNGMLAGAIDNVATAAVLAPASIGDEEYPTSGYACIGGKEIVSFTRSGEALTITRGEFNTTAISHEANERVQLIINYAGDDVANIIADLLENYAGVDYHFIPITEWQQETADHLDVIYARRITEPTPVKKLLSEIIKQSALALWWDEQAQLVRLKVLREISTDADTFDESMIVLNTLETKEQPDKRKSQIWTFYGQRNPTDRGDNEDNYRNGLATINLEKELEYGSQEIDKTSAGWIQTESAAERFNQIQMSRFQDPPRNFKFDLHPDAAITAGQGYRLKWRMNQNEHGATVDEGSPIQITRVAYDEGIIHVEAEEMLASGAIVLTNTVLLTTTGGLQSFTVPTTWNSANNSIHVLGAGAGGSRGDSSDSGDGGGGGGGGAYSSVTNLTLTPNTSVSYQVGDGGIGGVFPSTAGTDGEDSWFNGATLAASSVGAKGGGGSPGGPGANGGAGGQASSGVGTTKTSGGNGGPGYEAGGSRAGGGGGGGAGGPAGNGATGGGNAANDRDSGAGGGAADGGEVGGEVASSGSSPGGEGGDNRFNFGGGTGATDGVPPGSGEEGAGGGGGFNNQTAGATGGTGEQYWTQTIAPIISAGPGGGGGGGGYGRRGGDGGNYGGGGGGGGSASGPGGDGAQGVIVLTWREA